MKIYFLFKNGCLGLAKASKVDFSIFSFFLHFLFYEFSKIKIPKNTENMKNHFLVKIGSLGLAKVPKVDFSIL